MRLWLVVKENFAVYVVERENSDHDCYAFLSEDWLPPNTTARKEKMRLLRLIQQACRNPLSLSDPCHTITDGIWQFKVRGGSYRIPWFYDEGKVIICTHYFVKKNQKTPKEEQERAIRIKQEYFDKKEKGTLEWKR
ncbi:MAG: type II toxin-antitoxin system RelE/ParE family toxin [Bacteroidia bacterium]|nr:type II toxin-antitoxin system RelE/ParE family toxin [Bacteroidia bacterium]